MHDLLTIEDIARRTGLEESLLRFYESEFPDELPEGRLRGDHFVFPAEACEAFQRIHQRYLRQNHDRVEGQSQRYGRVIAITSGKGGAGKSSLALNLAVWLQRLGAMALVVDGDMGLANLHIMAGLSPAHHLGDVLAGRCTLADCITEGPEGIGLIAGLSGALLQADATPAQRAALIAGLAEVEARADVVLVDTGAGMGREVRDFLGAADEILFVLTPDLTSLADGYALLKGLAGEGVATGRLRTVVNQAASLAQAAAVARRFADCARRFLGLAVEDCGYLLKDATAGRAVNRRTPFAVLAPESRVSRNCRNIAAALLAEQDPEPRLTSAFHRYRNLVEAAAA